jgi:deoxyribonuclease-1-like protein
VVNNCRRKSLVISFFIIFCFLQYVNAQTTLISWNLKDFGKSKSDEEINFIANTLKNYDIVAIQEVVAGEGGAQAVARLADVKPIRVE